MTRGRINSEDIAALRARVPIEDIISERVTLRRTGSGLTGLCPFHDETSPSFSVSPARGLFHCLAGETGVITSEGIVPIRELAGKTATVIDGMRNWVEVPLSLMALSNYGLLRYPETARKRLCMLPMNTDGSSVAARTFKTLASILQKI